MIDNNLLHNVNKRSYIKIISVIFIRMENINAKEGHLAVIVAEGEKERTIVKKQGGSQPIKRVRG
jgi:hypothetical protein